MVSAKQVVASVNGDAGLAGRMFAIIWNWATWSRHGGTLHFGVFGNVPKNSVLKSALRQHGGNRFHPVIAAKTKSDAEGTRTPNHRIDSPGL